MLNSVLTVHSLPEESLFSQYLVPRMLCGESATTTLKPLDKKFKIESLSKAFTRMDQVKIVPNQIFLL